MIKILLIALLMVSVFSQNSSGFSVGETGNWVKSNSATSFLLGRGTTGFGENVKNKLNILNSSTWYNSDRTILDLNIVSSSSMVDLGNSSSSIWGTQLGTLAWVTNLLDSTMAFGVTISSLYENTSKSSTAMFNEIDGELIEVGNKLYENTGNINEIKAGLSARITESLSFGFDALYYQGSLTIDERQDFVSSSGLSESKKLFEKQNVYNGISFGFNFSTHLLQDKLNIGGGYTFEKELNSSAKRIFKNGVSRSQNTETEVAAMPFTVPSKLMFGAEYKTNHGYYFTDLRFEKSTERSSSSNMLAIGYESIPSKQLFDSFLKRSSYSFGAYYYNENFKVNNNDVINYGISVGMSLPFNYNLNNLSLGLSYGKRGDNNKNGRSESVFKFSIGLSIGEFWYISPEDN